MGLSGKSNHSRIAAWVMALLAVSPLAACYWACSPDTVSVAQETIILGDLYVDSSLFIYIAEEQNYFQQNGIVIESKTYSTGPQAIEALNQAQIDLATTGEYPVVRQSFLGSGIHIICSMDNYQAFYLVARRDLGIESLADLRGKTIGLTQKALPEFYFGRFINLGGMNLDAVQVVNVNPADWVSSIVNGNVDAVVVNQTYLATLQATLAENYIVWSIQNHQAAFGLLVCSDVWLSQHQDTLEHFLRALFQAEQYVIKHPQEARALLQKKFNYSRSYLDSLWPEHQFDLELDQSLIVAMEDEARWIINNNLTEQKNIPDFLNYIYFDGLARFAPQAINIIR